MDSKEINLLLCEILKAGWSVEELAKLIQRLNKSKAPDLPNGDDFAVKVLTDAIVTIGQQQSGLVERLEQQLNLRVKMTAIGFPIFNPPAFCRAFSHYVSTGTPDKVTGRVEE